MAEWSAAVAAAAFVALVAGLLIGLRIMLRRLGQAQASIVAMQADMHRLSTEIGAVLQPVEQTARGVQQSLEAAGGLVQAVRQVSGTVERTSSAVERVATTLSASAVKHAERIAAGRQLDEAAQWAQLGLTAWHLWQSRGKAEPPRDSRTND